MWSFTVIQDFEKGIAKCGESFSSSDNPYVFSHPALLTAWCDTYRPIRNLTPIFITGTSTNGNTVTFPMVLWKRNWKTAFIKTLVPVGYSDFDYHDPIFKLKPNDGELKEFWSELISFLKTNVKSDSISIDGVTDEYALEQDNWEKGEICPMLNLQDIADEDQLMKFFKTSLRGDLRRQIRRLSEIGEVSLTEYHSFEDIPETTFSTFMHQHALRWPKAYKAPKLHENILRYGLKAGCAHFSVLNAGEQEVAWHLGFEYNGRYYYYMPCGHQDYLKHSPTKVHLFYLVSRAIEKGYAVFDHLRGDENYKDGWSNGLQYVNTLIANNETAISTFKHNMLKIRHLITLPDKTLTSSYLRCTNTYKYAA